MDRGRAGITEPHHSRLLLPRLLAELPRSGYLSMHEMLQPDNWSSFPGHLTATWPTVAPPLPSSAGQQASITLPPMSGLTTPPVERGRSVENRSAPERQVEPLRRSSQYFGSDGLPPPDTRANRPENIASSQETIGSAGQPISVRDIHTLGQQGLFHCPHCGKGFNRERIRERHIEKNHG